MTLLGYIFNDIMTFIFITPLAIIVIWLGIFFGNYLFLIASGIIPILTTVNLDCLEKYSLNNFSDI